MTNISITNPFKANTSLFKWIVFIIVLLLVSNMYSQRVSLEGKISAAADVDVEGINILNLSSNKGTVTNANGEFWIAVALNDTLSISAIHIQATTLVIGYEQMVTKKIAINLSEKMNELAAVTLRRSLTGYVGSDANIIHTSEPITATSIGLPNADLKKIPKTQRLLSAANSGPVDALINMISGRTKMLKRRVEFEKTYQLTLSLLDKFPESYFTDALKIEEFKVYSFIFYCEDDPDYKKVMKGNSMEIIAFLNRKSREYRSRIDE